MLVQRLAAEYTVYVVKKRKETRRPPNFVLDSQTFYI